MSATAAATPQRLLAAATLAVALAIATALPAEGLSGAGRLSLFGFGCATIAWVLLPMNPAFVALAVSGFLMLAGVIGQDSFLSMLGNDIVWLMIGAFVLGEAVTRTGLAKRLNHAVAGRARRVDQLFWLISATLLALAFLIPSTSARASVLLPLHKALEPVIGERATRALSLLIPSIILVTTIAALTGAASHLVANDLLAGMTGRRIGFLEWALYGLPFAVAAGAATCWVVLRMSLSPSERAVPLVVPGPEIRPWSREERIVALVGVAMVGLWLGAGWLGLSIATVAALGAIFLMSPVGALRWSDGLKAINWDLILFVGAALLLGKSLIDTGAAGWLTQRFFAAMGFSAGASPLLVIAGVAFGTLAAHLVMISHAARAAALVPPLVLLAGSLGMDPVALVFIGTVGMNYCLTLPVSSKALLLFHGTANGIAPAQLVKLSAVLAPVHLVLMVVFYFGYWRHVGLAL